MTKEFKIKSLPDIDFRVKEMNAIELLALQTQISFDDMDKSEKLINTVLERLEVKVTNNWLPVKEKNRGIYYPVDIEKNIVAINELVVYFIKEYLAPLFQQSALLKDVTK